MANPELRHPQNVPGPWFADTTCIDCDAVRHLAPGLFAEGRDGLSYVARQPSNPEEELAAARALLACPAGSVGGPLRRELVARAFPWEIAPGIFLLGYTSRKGFGAMGYLVERPEGNLMVDSPRWTSHLVTALEGRGGLRGILLTHRDDVADAGRYAERFGARVVVHRDDGIAAPRGATLHTFQGDEELQRGVVAIATPGHTRGSAMYLVDDAYLFTGDSLYGSRTTGDLAAFADATWYSWEAQADSLERVAREYTFAWVLPGHGGRFRAPPGEMRRRLLALVDWMRRGRELGEW